MHKFKKKTCHCYHSIFHLIRLAKTNVTIQTLTDTIFSSLTYLQISQITLLEYFLRSTFTNTLVQFLLHPIHSFTTTIGLFLISCCVLNWHLIVWNLIVPRNNLLWSRLPAFSHSRSLIIKVERPLVDNLKLNHIDGVPGMLKLRQIRDHFFT